MINVTFDPTAGESFQSPVIKKVRTASGKPALEIAGWEKEEQSVTIQVPSALHRNLNEGELVNFTLREGALGFPWIEQVKGAIE